MNNKFGIIDKSGREIIPCKYDIIIPCRDEGVILAQLEGKWGLFSLTGDEIVPCKYDDLLEYTDGLAAAELDGKYGFIDNQGREIIPFVYDDATSFHEGMARVGKGNLLDRRYGYVNREGQEVISCKFLFAADYSEGLASVYTEDEEELFIDKKGQVIITSEYYVAGNFDHGLAKIEENDKFGLIDKTGSVIVPCIYDGLGSFEQGVAVVSKSPTADFTPDVVLPSFDELTKRIESSNSDPVFLTQDPFVFAVYRTEDGYDVDAAYCLQEYREGDDESDKGYRDVFKKERILSGVTSLEVILSRIKTYMDSIETARHEELKAIVNEAVEDNKGKLTYKSIAEKLAPKIIEAVSSENRSSHAVFFKYDKAFVAKCEEDLWNVKEGIGRAIYQLVRDNPVWKEAEDYADSPDDLSLQLEIRWFDESLPIMIEGTMIYYHMETYIPMQQLETPYCYYEGALKSCLAQINRQSYEQALNSKEPVTFYNYIYNGEYEEVEIHPDDNASIMGDNLLTGLIVHDPAFGKEETKEKRINSLVEYLKKNHDEGYE